MLMSRFRPTIVGAIPLPHARAAGQIEGAAFSQELLQNAQCDQTSTKPYESGSDAKAKFYT